MIKCAAIIKDGKVYEGRRHCDCIMIYGEAMMAEKKTPDIVRSEDQGFVTDTGEFVDREKAYEIAIACGQYNRTSRSTLKILFSEDIY